ncbi:MAG: antitoxin component YwqK of YwqJK toxin-antitoxin module [Crocinitomix sp.]
MRNILYTYTVKLILTTAIGLLFSIQLLAQSFVADSVEFEKLVETEKEIRSGGTIHLYHYNSELYTGCSIEKKLTSYYVYQFKNGRKHGVTAIYSKTNRKKQEWEYHKGMLRSSREWYMDGDLKNETLFTRKSRYKKRSVWHRNGQLKETFNQGKYSSNQKVKRYSQKGKTSEKGQETSIESGKKMETIKVGKWLYFDRKGKRKKIEFYDEQGHLISSKKV